VLGYALSCCARSLRVSSKGKENRQIVQWWWAAGQSLFMLAMAAPASVSWEKRTQLGEADEAETTAATGVAVLDDNLRMSVIGAKMEVMVNTYGLLDLACCT
jgi:hypothetical protein